MDIPIDFYAETVATIALVAVWIALLLAYRRDPEKDKRTLGLSFGYAFFGFATLAGLLGILLVLMGYPPDGLPLFVERFVYVFAAFGTVPMSYFVLKLFYMRLGKVTYLFAAYATVLTVIYLLVPSSVISMAPEAPTVWNTDLLPGLALLSITWIVFIILAVKCFRTAGKVKDDYTRRRFRVIGLAGVLGVMVFFINAVTVLVPPSTVSYVSAISWSVSALAGIVSYIGWVRLKRAK